MKNINKSTLIIAILLNMLFIIICVKSLITGIALFLIYCSTAAIQRIFDDENYTNQCSNNDEITSDDDYITHLEECLTLSYKTISHSSKIIYMLFLIIIGLLILI